MKNINTYQSNKETDAFKATQDLKNFIAKYVKNKYSSDIIKDLSNLTKIPKINRKNNNNNCFLLIYIFKSEKKFIFLMY